MFFASLMIDDIQTAVARRRMDDARTGKGGRGDRVRGRINHRHDVVAITSWHEAIYPGRASEGGDGERRPLRSLRRPRVDNDVTVRGQWTNKPDEKRPMASTSFAVMFSWGSCT